MSSARIVPFQAFSRLSLAKNSNMLLEIMVCLLPKSRDEMVVAQ